MPEICSHDIKVCEYWASGVEFKVSLCRKCLEVKKVITNGMERSQHAMAGKELQIARMSVLKVATDIALHSTDFTESTKERLLSLVKSIGEELEQWVVYR